MSLHVELKVIRPGECSVTEMTLERFHSRVFSVMSRQFVGSGKLPVTAEPGTLVGFLPRVGPLVGLEVGTLGVDLVAVGEVARMCPPVPEGRDLARPQTGPRQGA